MPVEVVVLSLQHVDDQDGGQQIGDLLQRIVRQARQPVGPAGMHPEIIDATRLVADAAEGFGGCDLVADAEQCSVRADQCSPADLHDALVSCYLPLPNNRSRVAETALA